MQIGFSFFWPVILGLADPNQPDAWQRALPPIDETLNHFHKFGIESIEIKLTEHLSLPLLFQAIEKLVRLGFHVTFHASGRFRFPEDIQAQLENLSALANFIKSRFQQQPIIVIHPLNSKTQSRAELMMQTLAYLKQLHGYAGAIPAHFALEILRNRADSPKIHIGDSYQEVLDILNRVGDGNWGICWDFGHAIAMYQRGLQNEFPPPEFIKKVIHCHVHDCSNQKTHLPLGMGSVPIEQNIQLLQQNNYNGILNLELVPHKIDDPWNFMDYVQQSVARIYQLLKQAK
ncbi:MAG: sugar phosphate isomerase/epimerase [candidate division KSB1 bacterium]|nr:sugar phosphate isomerase/epimerase [candidate division KSB1 bacterium]MDZ7342847.1 sugar phosphate isomerase/epimerase [candidate division KSB1 bacterium]